MTCTAIGIESSAESYNFWVATPEESTAVEMINFLREVFDHLRTISLTGERRHFHDGPGLIPRLIARASCSTAWEKSWHVYRDLFNDVR